ncbi:hypothetical protein Barb6_01435 [Bacteroidales bacterium Barb6]|nr:hypothetical protein Barb6_01435 [Bacteroidales bacterium Barb6]
MIQNVTYNIRSFFQNFPDCAVLITPHFALLHVGLKSCILSGYHRRYVLLTPHSATLHVGLNSFAPLGHLHNISYNFLR